VNRLLGSTVLVVNGQPVPDLVILPDPILDPAQPVITWAPVEGGVDIDVSTSLSGGVPMFERRQLVVECALVSGETLWDARRRLSEAWQGQQLKVSFEETPGRHLLGRCTLSDWSWPGKGEAVLFKFILDADPYLYDDTPTRVSVAGVAAPGAPFTLTPTGYPVMPSTTVTGADVTIIAGGKQTPVPVGVTDWVDGLLLQPGIPVSGVIIGTGTAAFLWTGGTPG